MGEGILLLRLPLPTPGLLDKINEYIVFIYLFIFVFWRQEGSHIAQDDLELTMEGKAGLDFLIKC